MVLRGLVGKVAVASALMCVAGLSQADNEDRRVKVINETSYTIIAFHGSNAGQDSWEEDILGDEVLRPGKSIMINFDDGSGYCKFDFLVRFEDGDQIEKRGIDVCKTSIYRLTE